MLHPDGLYEARLWGSVHDLIARICADIRISAGDTQPQPEISIFSFEMIGSLCRAVVHRPHSRPTLHSDNQTQYMCASVTRRTLSSAKRTALARSSPMPAHERQRSPRSRYRQCSACASHPRCKQAMRTFDAKSARCAAPAISRSLVPRCPLATPTRSHVRLEPLCAPMTSPSAYGLGSLGAYQRKL